MAFPPEIIPTDAELDLSQYVYHYTKRRVAMEKILATKKIRLGPLSQTSDPRESRAWSFGMSFTGNQDRSKEKDRPGIKRVSEALMTASSIIQDNIKVLCTTMDDPSYSRKTMGEFGRGYSHSRMWAQYSEDHEGVCLIFHKGELHRSVVDEIGARCKLFSGSVQYSDASPEEIMAFGLPGEELFEMGVQRYLEMVRERDHEIFFFTKSTDWSQEFEYRWVAIGDDDEPEFVSIEPSIAGLVVGVDFPEVYIPSLKMLCDDLNIVGGRISWDNGIPHVFKRFAVPHD